MSTIDFIEQKEEAALQARESATECGLCGVKFGVGPGLERKARGIVDKDQPGLAACLECAESIYGDTNVDGDPMADDDELQNRAERAHEAWLSAYYGGGTPMNDAERAEADAQRRDFR